MAREIIRGDSYIPFYWLTFLNSDGNSAYDLTDKTIRTTYKPEVVSPELDADDDTAIIKHFITFDAMGDVTDSEGFFTDSDPTEGLLGEYFTPEETLLFEVGTQYISDVEITGTDDGYDLVKTFLYLDDPITAIDGVTNRTSDA